MDNFGDSSLLAATALPKAVVFGNRAGNLFILDVTPKMLIAHDDEGSHCRQFLIVLEKILKEKLLYNREDYVGFILLGTKKSDTTIDNIFTEIPFGPINLDALKKIVNLIEKNDEDLSRLSSDKHYPLAEVLRYAQRIFGTVKVNMPFRRVDLITCQDQVQKKEEAHQVRVAASTFKDGNVEFKVTGLGDDWNYNAFWKDVDILANGQDAVALPNKLEDLDCQVLRRGRNIGRLELRINNQVLIKVNLQPYAKSKSRLAAIYVDRKTNEPLTRYTTHQYDRSFDDDDDDVQEFSTIKLMTQKCTRQINYGYRDIRMTSNEFRTWRYITNKGIDIINFVQASNDEKPKLHLQKVCHLGLPPNAPMHHKKLFAALLLQCQEKNVAAICTARIRANAQPYRYKMWPNPEEGGFYFYRLPWAEEIRKNLQSEFHKYDSGLNGIELNASKLEVMMKVVKRLRIRFRPSLFPNPKESKKMMYILCLSLFSKGKEPEFQDPTQPDIEQMRDQLQKKGLMNAFYELFPERISACKPPPKKKAKLTKTAVYEMIKQPLDKYSLSEIEAIAASLDFSINDSRQVLEKKIVEFAVKRDIEEARKKKNRKK